ncbi:hypothetical protein CYY_005337 [Polysphondylium violaceum]|uniref:DOCK family protein n=1 Tax=Polysphondylium violaceum TaxID=133409 RepID=A0A8J4Q3B3_9MYCE|nr:hypothetical protein CYY_005337 [Polysphondylium violaceum]
MDVSTGNNSNTLDVKSNLATSSSAAFTNNSSSTLSPSTKTPSQNNIQNNSSNISVSQSPMSQSYNPSPKQPASPSIHNSAQATTPTTTGVIAKSPSASSGATLHNVEYKFEEYEELFFAKQIINDPLKISVIKDLLSIQNQKRTTNIVGSNVPEQVLSEHDKLPQGIQESINIFKQEWTVVNRDLPPPLTSTPFKVLPIQTYTCDGNFDESSAEEAVKKLTDELIPNPPIPTPDPKSVEFMKTQRVPLFQTYYINDDLPTIELPRVGLPLTENVGFQFIVECTQFKPTLGEFEPFFGRMFLFDANPESKEGVVITEEFHFDLGKNLELLPKPNPSKSMEEIEAPTKIQKCLFNLNYRSSDIYLVICFDKVILGDPEETTKPYFNTPGKPKEIQKFQNEVTAGLSRLGNFKQPFVWGCVELFDSNKKFIFDQPDNDLKLTYFSKSSKSPSDLLTFITKDMKKQHTSKSENLFDCNLKITPLATNNHVIHSSTNGTTAATSEEKYRYNETVQGRIDYLLRPKEPYHPGGDGQPSAPLVREVIQFDEELAVNTENGGTNESNSSPDNIKDSMSNLSAPLSTKETTEPFLTYTNLLYFYPKSVNLTNYKSDKGSSARNIFLEIKLLEDDTNVNNRGLKSIHGTSTTPILTKSLYTSVVYHNKKPKFEDEIKINLPPNLTPNHHLLITFYHLGCRQSKKSDKPETALGYCAIRLFDNQQIILDGKHKKPVATVFPPKYLAQEARDPKDPSANLKFWVDNKRPVFSFKTRVISSLYPQDPVLSALLRDSLDGGDQATLTDNFKKLSTVSAKYKTQFFPAIIRVLFKVIVTQSLPIETVSAAFNALLQLVDSVPEDILSQYITYVFNSESVSLTLYDSLIQTWNHLLESSEQSQILLSIQYSWFLFGIIRKSMIADVNKKGDLNTGRNRTPRFQEEFLNRLRHLFDQLLMHLKQSTKLLLAKKFIVNIAFFINDLLDIMNRGFIFKLIYNYVTGLDTSNNSMEMTELKSRFFRVLSLSDSFIALNLPNTFTFPPLADVYTTFYKKHFIIGLLLQEVSACLAAKEKDLRLKMVHTLREIMAKYDLNPLYNSQSMRERICSLYFPYVLIVVNAYDQISRFSADEQRSCALGLFLHKNPKIVEEETLSPTPLPPHIITPDSTDSPKRKDKKTPKNNSNGGPNVSQKEGNASISSSGNSVTLASPANRDKTKALIEQSMSSSMGGSQKAERTYSICQQQASTLGTSLGSSSATTAAPGGSSPLPGLRSFANSMTIDPSLTLFGNDIVTLMNNNLTCEVSLTVLNCLIVFIKENKQELLKNQQSTFVDMIFKVILKLIKQEQAHSITKVMFTVLSSLVSEFRTTIFKMNNSICSELTQAIFDYCSSKHAPDRQMGTTLIVLFIQNNLKEMGHFSRMKLQSTVSISEILNNREKENEAKKKKHISVNAEEEKEFYNYLYADLESITKYVKQLCNNSLLKSSVVTNSKFSKPARPQAPIAQQIDELKQRLIGVIHNNVQIQQYSYDPEMKADLYYSLSTTFIESPDLRITWLKSLAEFLKANSNYEEAAQVSIIAAALVNGYLKLLNRIPKELMDDFSIISPNVPNELTLPDPTLLEDVEGEICKLADFTEQGFVNLLKDAIYVLKKGSFFESCAETYRLLLPTYQRNRDWQRQRDSYQELVMLCNQITIENTVKQRIFSNYYRVAFYCQQLIPEIHGKEYVYKELNFVRLSDLSERLQKQYGDKFGDKFIHLLPNNKPVEVSSLDPAHLYIQIVSVDPYLVPEELKIRKTPFEQNTNLNKFIFEIPFTKSGKVHGESVTEQWKKKVILTTQSYFPYMKKRLLIIKKEEIELTPIEASIELIQKKVNVLRAELNSRPANTKTLQINLQGCLLLQVNAGPLAICSSFLSEKEYSKHNAEHITKLQEVMREFTNVLEFSLKFNHELTKDSEGGSELQEQLTIGYNQFREKVSEYVQLSNEVEDLSININPLALTHN